MSQAALESRVASARDLWSQDEQAAALAEVREVWLDSRAPAAGVLLRMLDRRLDVDGSWLDELPGPRDPRRASRLLMELRSAQPTRARLLIEQLAAVAPDPRIVDGYAELATSPPPAFTTAAAQPFWKAFGDLLVSSVDGGVDLRPAIRTTYLLRAASPGYEAGRYLDVAHSKAHRMGKGTPLPGAEAWAASLVSIEDREIDVLRRAVADRPHDTHAAAVLGDALLSNGDPEGELIRLQQVDGPRAAELQPRIARLIRRHRVRWLGDLATMLDVESVVFRGGLPVEGAVGVNAAFQPPAAFLANRRWQTFQALDLKSWQAGPALIDANRWPALLELRGASGLVLASPQLERLRSFEGQATARQLSEAKVRLLNLHLRHAGPPEDFVWRASVFERLTRLVVDSWETTAWLQEAPRISGRFSVGIQAGPSVTVEFPRGLREAHLHWRSGDPSRFSEAFRRYALALRDVERVVLHAPGPPGRLVASHEISGRPEIVVLPAPG